MVKVSIYEDDRDKAEDYLAEQGIVNYTVEPKENLTLPRFKIKIYHVFEFANSEDAAIFKLWATEYEEPTISFSEVKVG